MPSFANSTLRLLRRVLGAPARDPGPHAGTQIVLDGNTAVAETEAAICETADLGGSFPADSADLAWRTEQQRLRTNAFGSPLSSRSAEGPRGALAAATGHAMSGLRATSFLSGPDLAACRDLLSSAADSRLPLVLHLAGRTTGGQGASLGNGHGAFHLAADAGCLVLAASNVQEAVDFSLVARRAAEQALHPGIVAMDGEQTALAVQDLHLAPAGLVEDFLGGPDDRIPCGTQTQNLLFGDTRRRLPRWHDPDHPVLLGALQPSEVGGPGRAGGQVFLDGHLNETLDAAFEEFARLTGRDHRPLSVHRLDDAKLVLVAMGAALETAEAAADEMRAKHRAKVGVIGIRRLHPFPGAQLTRLLTGRVRVCVLECTDRPPSDDPPLLKKLRAAIDRARENGSFGAETHARHPALAEGEGPRFLSAIYGLGGLPLRGADLTHLCLEADRISRARVYLGISFSPSSSAYPKRQVLLDRLRRAHPDIADLGLRDSGQSPDLRPPGAITLAIHRRSQGPGAGLAAEAAAFLHRVGAGSIRGRPALFTRPWGDDCTDRVTSGHEGLRDPGDEPPTELALLLTDPGAPGQEPHAGLTQGGSLLVQTALPEEVLWVQLPEAARAVLKAGRARLFRVPPPEGAEQQANDYLLGAAWGLMLGQGLLDMSRRRLLGAREEMLRQSVADVDERLDAFEAGLDAPREIDTGKLPQAPAQASAATDDEAPALVRRIGGVADSYDSLPRFWDQVGVLYHNGDTAELAPDPYLALGAIPPLSTGFRDLSRLRDSLPHFDPTLCTGCGDCWSACPDAAIGSTALTPAQLISAGIGKAGADALRPLASKLASGVADLCRDPEARRPTAGELIGKAYERIEAKLPFPEERKRAIGQGLNDLVADLGCLPLAVTEPLFSAPEAENRGSGALLVLSLNPRICKACGICVRHCEPGALQSVRQGSQSLAQARRIQELWETLPAPAPETVRAAAQHPDLGPLAAKLLGHKAAETMAGGDGVEPGSGARLALRLALAALEAQQTPLFERFAQEVAAAQEKITALIRDILADALPSDDLDALAQRLQGVESRQADLSAFLGEAKDAIDGAVDAARLRRLVDLARDLGDLARRLTRGSNGLGRAHFGVVLAPCSPVDWAGAFPDNPFAQPVTMDWTGDGAQLAAGLLEGQLRQAIGGFVLMRRARLELERSADAARLWSDLDGLTWRKLDDEEQALCPSLLLAGDSGTLGGKGLSQVVRLLGGDLPLRVLLLADLDLGLGTRPDLDLPPSPRDDAATDLGLLAISQRGAYVAQTSIAAPDHLAASLEGAFTHPGPALLHLHAPSPARHGFAVDRTLERARQALTARVFPLFRYDPRSEGVFGSRIDLDGNPAPRQPWEDLPDGGAFTPAQWALGERRFADLFSPLGEDAPDPIPLAEYLALSEKERGQRTAFVEQAANGAAARRFRVDERLVQTCQERQQAWRVLQELAGLVTPFTARVQKEAQARVAAEHQAKIEALKADYEQRLRELRAQYQQELRQDIRDRLMLLAGYGRAPEGEVPGTRADA
ncbi:MAG: 4Fe-4S binding protein [Pseudomonadota bacterium]|nr:4Fe-4S binding protein [Pseudomonadota bacterium]